MSNDVNAVLHYSNTIISHSLGLFKVMIAHLLRLEKQKGD